MVTISQYGYIEKGKLHIINRKRLDAEISQVKDCDVEIIIKKKGKRSSQQNRYYFGVVVYEITKKFRELGNDVNTEDVHEGLKQRFNPKYIKNENGEVITEIPGTTTELNKDEFTEYVERVRQWASEKMDLVIPDPSTQTSLEYFK